EWALAQIRRLNERTHQRGALERDDQELRRRCEEMVRRLRGEIRRSRNDFEGVDDTNTYAVLAAESFLPGYGLDTGSVAGWFRASRLRPGRRAWEVRRAPTVALREFVA